jgi:uncharacterized tellurite resistance protein B-like protein
MLNELIRRFAGPDSPDPLSPSDSRIALAALMVRLARSDGRYSPRERERIDRVLAARYALDTAQVQTLREEAESLEAEAPDTVRFTRTVKGAVPYPEREAVVEALWRVADADEGISADEQGFLRLVANLLGVSDVDSGMARQRVQDAPEVPKA